MKSATGAPVRPLVVLTVAVLVLHGLALQVAPGVPAAAPRPAARPAPLLVRAFEPMPEPAAPARAGAAAGPRAAAAAVGAPKRARPAPARAAAAPHPAPPAPARSPAPAAAPATPATPSASAGPAFAPAPATAAQGATPPVAALSIPGPARWHYRVAAMYRGQAVTGGAQLTWRHDRRSYEAVLEVRAPPLPARLQRSTGLLIEEGLAPLRFSERLRSEQATHFDRERGRIVFSSNRPPVVMQAGTQDRLSVLLQLAARAAGDPAGFAPGAVVTMPVATTREALPWPFEVEGPQPLVLPAGRVDAIRLARPPQHEFDVRIEVWLVPGADYGPVRLRLTAPHGDWLDLLWSGTDNG